MIVAAFLLFFQESVKTIFQFLKIPIFSFYIKKKSLCSTSHVYERFLF